jgi:hypothetical protein
MWMLGIVVILAGVFLLYFEAGLSRWVSLGIVGAGVLLFVGMAIMAFASGAPSDPSPTPANPGAANASTERGLVVDRRPTYVEGDDRRVQ